MSIEGYTPPVQERGLKSVQRITDAFRRLASQNRYRYIINATLAEEADVKQPALYQWFRDGKETLIEVMALQEYEDCGAFVMSRLPKEEVSAYDFASIYLNSAHQWFTDAPQPSILLDDDFPPTFELMHRIAPTSWKEALSIHFSRFYPKMGFKRVMHADATINCICAAVKGCYQPMRDNPRYEAYRDSEIMQEHIEFIADALAPRMEGLR